MVTAVLSLLYRAPHIDKCQGARTYKIEHNETQSGQNKSQGVQNIRRNYSDHQKISYRQQLISP